MRGERIESRAKTIAAIAVAVALVVAYACKADVMVKCRYSANRGGGSCEFTNPSLFPDVSACDRVVLTSKYSSPHVPSKSEPVCSGFLWPFSTTVVGFSGMDPDPFRTCDGSFDNCIMSIEPQ